MAEQDVAFDVKGLKQFEIEFAKLRMAFGTKTGGIIYRGLSAGAALVVKEAKRRAPKKDPSGFIRKRLEQQLTQKGGPLVKGQKRLKGQIGRSMRMIAQNIRQRKVKPEHPLAGGKPTVLIGVRNRGYDKVRNSRGKSILRFRYPGSSPGYWWWVELGTRRMAAKPFLRPAFKSKLKSAISAQRTSIANQIKALWQSKGGTYKL